MSKTLTPSHISPLLWLCVRPREYPGGYPPDAYPEFTLTYLSVTIRTSYIERRHTTEIASLSGQWQAVAGAYLAEVSQRTGSARTPQEYARYIARFLETIDEPADATPAQLHAFAYGPGPSGRLSSSSTVGVRLAALRGFYDFARRMRLIERNPADDVKRPKASEPTPRGLDADELQLLLEAVPATPSGARDRALIITAVMTGLRRAELLALRAGDLERRNCSELGVRVS